MQPARYQNIPRFLVGMAAMGLAVFFAFRGGLMIGPVLIASSFLLFVSATDTFRMRIPNMATLAMALTGFLHNGIVSGWEGVLIAGAGLLAGFLLLIAFWLLGGMGAGDVKALAALGALLGPWDIFQVFLYTGLIGGVLATLYYGVARLLGTSRGVGPVAALGNFVATKDLRWLLPEKGEKKKKVVFPYAAAIAFGYFAFIVWGRIV